MLQGPNELRDMRAGCLGLPCSAVANLSLVSLRTCPPYREAPNSPLPIMEEGISQARPVPGQHLQAGVGPSASASTRMVAAQPSRWARLSARAGSSSCFQMLLLYCKTIMTTAQTHLSLSFPNWKCLQRAQVISHSSQAPKLPRSYSNHTDQEALF